MKKLVFLFAFFSFVYFVSSCSSTSKAIVLDSADLSAHNYAMIADVSGVLIDMEARVYDAISATRLQIIGDGQMNQLSDVQKQQLLIVRFSALQSERETVVSINFVDYITGKPVAYCRGHVLGRSTAKKMRIAIDKAIEQMKRMI